MRRAIISGCFVSSCTSSQARPRIAYCVTGTWRSFGDAAIHDAIAKDVVFALGAAASEMGLFYVIDSNGVTISAVQNALLLLKPRMLAVDIPPLPVPECMQPSADFGASYLQFAQLRQCIDFIKHDEGISGMTWDWIVRLRTDMIPEDPLGPILSYDPTYVHMPYPYRFPWGLASWGYRHSQYVGNDRFALVPRHAANAYFGVFDELCMEPSLATFTSNNVKLEYMLLILLHYTGAKVRFSMPAFTYKRLERGGHDIGRTEGNLQAKSEALYHLVKRRQPAAFGGDGWVGAADFTTDPNDDLETETELGLGHLQVVLMPSWRFNDHVLIKIARLCASVSHPALSLDSVPLEIRVYRPSDTQHRFWRLIGTSGVDVARPIQIEQSHCVMLPLSGTIFAAPGDCLAYVMPFPPQQNAPERKQQHHSHHRLAQAVPPGTPLLAKALASVSEFDKFHASSSARALSISVKSEHVNHVEIGKHCFGSSEVRVLTFEYCCHMETLGPEGNAVCWTYASEIPSTNLEDSRYFLSYESCCIHHRNYLSGTVSAGSPAFAKRFVLTQLDRKRDEAISELESIQNLQQSSQPMLWANNLHVAAWWPREFAWDLEPILFHLPGILYQPERVCDSIMRGCDDCVKDLNGTTLLEYCPLILLFHARVAATVLAQQYDRHLQISEEVFPALDRPHPYLPYLVAELSDSDQPCFGFDGGDHQDERSVLERDSALKRERAAERASALARESVCARERAAAFPSVRECLTEL